MQRHTNGLLSVYQVTCNLLDEDIENPSILKGVEFDVEVFLKKEVKRFDIAYVCVMASVIAFIFHDFNTVLEKINVAKSVLKELVLTSYFFPIFYLFDGLISLSFARQDEKTGKWIANAEQNVLNLKNLCNDIPQNFLNKYRKYLLHSYFISNLNILPKICCRLNWLQCKRRSQRP